MTPTLCFQTTAFVEGWARAATTSAGFFWMAFWAFGLGYLVSGAIQVFVTRARMQRAMGETGPRSVALGTFFGFVSSSCSFAALSTSRTLFAKGAGFVPSLAFLLASTNLVIELGIVIATFLTWHFVVGEYVGGLLLIGFTWLLVRLTMTDELLDEARSAARETVDGDDEPSPAPLSERVADPAAWREVARRYLMEWDMVIHDVIVGFTVAGIIASFVPRAFFTALFVGSDAADPALWQVVLQSFIGPIAAFFTFIGSMGNIPLAAVLFANGVSFAGVMAFIFSDLVVFPVLRIQASYYGWRVAAYILGVFLVALVSASVLMHYGFAAVGMLPDASGVQAVTDREFFALDYTFALNVFFGLWTLLALVWGRGWFGGGFTHGGHDHDGHDREDGGHDHDHGSSGGPWLKAAAMLALVWLGGGLVAAAVV